MKTESEDRVEVGSEKKKKDSLTADDSRENRVKNGSCFCCLMQDELDELETQKRWQLGEMRFCMIPLTK